MPNTKNLKPASRKAKKRSQRRALKELHGSMSRLERAAFRKEEKLSFKVFLKKHREEARKKAEEEKAKKEAAVETPAAES